MKLNISKKLKQAGQGMSEYLIIVGLVAVSAIAVVGLFGNTIESQIAGFANELAGGDGSAAQQQAQGFAEESTTTAADVNDLSNYVGQNGGG